MDKITRNVMLVFLFVLVFVLLEAMSSILLPLALAFLCAVIFQPLILFLKRKSVPGWIIFPIVTAGTLLALFGVIDLMFQSGYEIYDQKDFMIKQITEKSRGAISWINRNFNLAISWRVIEKSITDMFTTKMLTQSAGVVATEIGSFTASFFMFALYYVVLLTGLSKYKTFLGFVGGESRGEQFIDNYEKIQKSIYSYLIIKTIVNLLQAVIVWAICSAFGLKFALVIGVIAFFIHYIPNIGSILSTVLPGLMAVVQFDDANTIVLLVALVGGAQFIMGNYVEPLIAGHQLKLNTVTVIFGLVFWGWLWGIAGMIMSVPLMVIIKLALEQIPDMSFIARLMSVPDKPTRAAAAPVLAAESTTNPEKPEATE